MKKTLIVIPVYNEETVVSKVTALTLEYSRDFADILFINDGSEDKSSEILQKIKNSHLGIYLIDKDYNEGYGASIISGLDFGIKKGYEFCITMDCDDQHQPSDLPRFQSVDNSIELVSGSRYLPDSGQKGISPPIDRVEINKRITYLMNKNYKFGITDSFCGYKRYKLSAFNNHNFEEKGYASPMELWSYVYHKHIKMIEIPVDRIYITDNRSFGEDLDKKRKRYHYYLKIWKQSNDKYEQMSNVSPLKKYCLM